MWTVPKKRLGNRRTLHRRGDDSDLVMRKSTARRIMIVEGGGGAGGRERLGLEVPASNPGNSAEGEVATVVKERFRRRKRQGFVFRCNGREVGVTVSGLTKQRISLEVLGFWSLWDSRRVSPGGGWREGV